MDFSDKYISICKKAYEVQETVKKRATDFADIFFNNESKEFCFGSYIDDDDIWLPRQEQLQDMLLNGIFYSLEFHNGLFNISSKYSNRRTFAIFNETSAELCYLKLVMNYIYHKNWDDKLELFN